MGRLIVLYVEREQLPTEEAYVTPEITVQFLTVMRQYVHSHSASVYPVHDQTEVHVSIHAIEELE